MNHVKKQKTQISRGRLTALKTERTQLREKVERMGKLVNFITPKVTARMVEPEPSDHPSAGIDDELPVVVVEVEYGGNIYQATIDARSFADGRTPEKLCLDLGTISAVQLIGPRIAMVIHQNALALLQDLQAKVKSADPQVDAFQEKAQGGGK